MVAPAIKTKATLFMLCAVMMLFVFHSRFCTNSLKSDPLASFSDSFSSPVNFDLDKIRLRGKIIALTDYSSTGYFVYRGEPMGYEFDMLSLFAKSQKLELEVIIAKDMNSIFDQLNSGEADIIAANLTVTSERSRYVAFTEHLLYTRQVLVQRKPE